jgi:hypothetical protein
VISAESAQDEQHVEDVAADDVAEGDVGVAPDWTACTETASSGELVPKATTVRPTTSGEMPTSGRQARGSAHEQLGAADEQHQAA